MLDVLRPAYRCRHFDGACRRAVYEPEAGYVPRGSLGATGTLEEVRLVLVIAEPSPPDPGETYAGTGDEILAQTFAKAYDSYGNPSSPDHSVHHRNVRFVMSQVWGDIPFDGQLRRTWITQSYLCSLPSVTGDTTLGAQRTCAHDYLAKQLALFPNRVVIALGRKAERRLGLINCSPIAANAVGKPEGVKPRARESWIAAAAQARRALAAMAERAGA
ncbi:hypothetical protein [Azospirillum tabaci]|uniref:hypothetical protein n=1 Tax=Azospirillum tabaci TaxID=2752310 RepID=UPI0016614333|nr:hypothetical protein [Azospirillum tabaci]